MEMLETHFCCIVRNGNSECLCGGGGGGMRGRVGVKCVLIKKRVSIKWLEVKKPTRELPTFGLKNLRKPNHSFQEI